MTEQPSLAAAFGGGGLLGIGYGLGIARALRDIGVELDSAPLLGTSAGAWVAGCMATGVEPERLEELVGIRVPDPTPGVLLRYATRVFGDMHASRVTASAVRLTTGRRVLLSGEEWRVADIVAASSAVPVLFRPTRLGGHSYVDGGVRSLVSADCAPIADRLLVVAPVAGPMFGAGGRLMERMLRREVRRWELRSGGVGVVVRPNAAIAALARHPLQLFDSGRARAAYELAADQVEAMVRSGRLDAVLAAA